MPLYDYVCDACEHHFEQSQTISNRKVPEELPCPECGEIEVKQSILSAPGMGDPVRLGVRRPDGGFKEVIQKIDSNNRHNSLTQNSSFDF